MYPVCTFHAVPALGWNAVPASKQLALPRHHPAEGIFAEFRKLGGEAVFAAAGFEQGVELLRLFATAAASYAHAGVIEVPVVEGTNAAEDLLLGHGLVTVQPAGENLLHGAGQADHRVDGEPSAVLSACALTR